MHDDPAHPNVSLTVRYLSRADAAKYISGRYGFSCSLFTAAKSGNVTAQIFWLKTRARWKEPAAEHKHSGSLGTYDMTKVSDADLARLESILAPVADAGTDPGGTGSA
jgi:hypothetical protein